VTDPERKSLMIVPFRALNRRAVLRAMAATGMAASARATGTFFAAASPAATLEATPAFADLDALLAAAVEQGIPGVSLIVEQGGRNVFSGADGVASLEDQTPLRITDRFRIYSLAKCFTAIIILRMVDEGVFTLDDTVTMRLDDPAVARIPNVDAVTIRQLLTHSSGIYDYLDETDSPFWDDAFFGPDADWSKVWTPGELVAYADGAKHDAYFPPGEGEHYSNTGYVLLGLIVEQATGHAFGEELQTRILTPLGLKDTFFVEGRPCLRARLTVISCSRAIWPMSAAPTCRRRGRPGAWSRTRRTSPDSPRRCSRGKCCPPPPSRKCSPSPRAIRMGWDWV
jgi:D-alanyl-D-alanine carboxypeptidase